MSSVRVIQADDMPRAISVQNPMSINDLMVNQPRRLSTSAMPRSGGPPPPSRRQGPPAPARMPIQLPPQAARQSRSPRPTAASPPPPEEEVDPNEMGYDLILNPQKKRKEDEAPAHHTSDPAQQDDDEIWPPEDDNRGQGQPDYVDPRERREYERERGGGMGGGPNLPPQNSSPHRPQSTPRRLSVRDNSPPGLRGFAPPPNNDFRAQSPPQFGGSGDPNKPYMSYEDQTEKKQKYLEGLDKFRRRGMKVPALDMNSPFEEVESEYNRHKRTVDVEASIQFSRKMLMACVTGLEYLNSRYDPLGLHLDGWSESVIEDIHNYDDVFERLYDKYHTSVQMAPEFELLLMVAGSAFMYHLTNSMFKSAMPGMGNPEMMKNVRRGVMGAMRGAFNGASDGGGVTGMMSGMFGGGGGGGGSAAPQPSRNNNGGRPGGPPRGEGPPPAVASRSDRREMRGPSGNMDDLLNNLMDREPAEVSERLVDEIDDILNNPSDDDTTSRNVRTRAPPPVVDI